jgi:hypothetical protein
MRTEDRRQSAHPIIAAALEERRAQAIGSRLKGRHIADGQEGVVRFAEANAVTSQLLGDERVQRADAERKGQVGRQRIFDGLLHRLETQTG